MASAVATGTTRSGNVLTVVKLAAVSVGQLTADNVFQLRLLFRLPALLLQARQPLNVRTMSASTTLELFAATAPGLETIALGELKRLGIKGKAEAGGVSFRGGAETMYSTNLWLRTAGRIIVRLARFHASTFHELERRAKNVAWAPFIPTEGTVRVRVTCRKSRLYHSDAVAERVLAAISKVVPGTVQLPNGGASETDDDSDVEDGGQLFIVRIVDDECEISADTSGELLHRRGYRQEIAKAPLRETLAAAMLLGSGWKPTEPLVDPMCGSGTIPIEAALFARGIAPGLRRRFAFMDWPTFEPGRWQEILGHAQQAASTGKHGLEIIGSDRDAGAIEASRNNAERAGVAGDIQFLERSLSDTVRMLDGFGHPGWILTNPPYGIRLGDTAGLANLYGKLGSALKSAEGWRLGILTSDTALARQTGLPLRARFSTRNGGIPVAFFGQEKASPARLRTRKSGVA